MNPSDSPTSSTSGPHLVIRLLGELRLTFNGAPLKGKLHRKVQAVLAYLAVESNLLHMREYLATFFWPDLPVDMARTNLRQTLYYLRRALGPDASSFLLTDRDTVQLILSPQCWLDVGVLSQSEARCQTCTTATPNRPCQHCLSALTQRFETYKGEFLAGFSLPDAPDFERWRDTQRETLRGQALALAERLCDSYDSMGDINTAVRYAQRCTNLEPWNESNQRRLMRLLAEGGQHGTAASCYDTYREGLALELDIQPEQHTRTLFEEIHKDSRNAPQLSHDALLQTNVNSGARRRQATVVCCHIAQLIDVDIEDFEQLAEPKMACVNVLRRHGGHVTLGHGDYIFAYLGYPVASEKAGDNAILAASELKTLFTSHYLFRVGIQTGTIITSFDPGLPDIIGAASTAALHLCQRAAQGEIIVNQTTQHMLRSRFKFHAVGRRDRNNPPSANTLYKFVGKKALDDKRDAVQRPTLLIGRNHEVTRLRTLWKRATHGHKQLLMLCGEAGLGKSRLVKAVRDMARKTSANIRTLHCFREHQHTPLYPLITLLESTLGFLEHDTTATRHAKLSTYLNTYHPSLADQATPIVSTLLSIASPDVIAQPPLVRKRQSLDIILAMLDSLAAQRPLLLIIEDLQWIDLSSMDILKYLAQRDGSARMFILLTARDALETDWLNSSVTMKLNPLKDKDIARIVRATDATLTQEAVQHIVTRADGIPLYAEELSLMKSKAWDNTNAIPATLHYLLLARIDAVSYAQRVMQLAATIGRNFDTELLRRAANLDETNVKAALCQLTRAQLIAARSAPHNDFQFHHALIQETAYASQVASDRQEAHQNIAEALRTHFPLRAEQQPGQVARHYTAAGNIIAAIPWWIKAGQQALHVYANVEASTHLRTGLMLIGDLQANKARGALELSLLLPLGRALLMLHGYGSPEAMQIYDRALTLNTEQTPDAQKFETLWGQWMVSSSRVGSGFLKSEQLAQELLDIAQASGHIDLILEAYSARTNIAVWRNELDLAVQYAHAGLAQSDGLPHQNTIDGPNPLVAILAHLSWAYSRQGKINEAREASRLSIKLSGSQDSPDTACFALFFAAVLESFWDNADAVKIYADQLATVSERYELTLWQGTVELMQGWVQAFNGDAEGLPRIEAGVRLFQAIMPGVSACTLHILARAYDLLGRDTEQLRAIEQGLQASDNVHERFFKTDLLRLRQACLARQKHLHTQQNYPYHRYAE